MRSRPLISDRVPPMSLCPPGRFNLSQLAMADKPAHVTGAGAVIGSGVGLSSLRGAGARNCIPASAPQSRGRQTRFAKEDQVFSHVMIGSNDISRSKTFYDALFSAMGGKPGTQDPKGRLVYS